MLDKMGVKYELVDITKNPDVLQKYPIMAAPGVIYWSGRGSGNLMVTSFNYVFTFLF